MCFVNILNVASGTLFVILCNMQDMRVRLISVRVVPADTSAQTRCGIEDALAAAGSTNQRVETGRV